MKPSYLAACPAFYASLALAFFTAAALPARAVWKDFDEADVVLGRSSLPSPLSLYMPYDIAINPASGKAFVVDHGNNRVLRYSSAAALGSGQPAEAAFGQPDLYSGDAGLSQTALYGPQAVAVDASGRLWVTDTENHRVLRWNNADTAPSGSAAAQVVGQTDFVSRSSGITQTKLSRPGGLAIDAQGRLWIADYFNNRVLRYDDPSTKGNGGAADGLLGQPNFTSNGFGTTATTFKSPYDLDVDAQGRLWVADFDNSRILRFDNPTSQIQPPANGVLAQPDFTSSTKGVGQAIANRVITLEVTASGSLFAVDTQNARILRWDNAATAVNGAPANGVLGRTGFNQNSPYSGTAGSIGSDTRGMTSDAAGRLWAADRGFERVLRFDNAAAKANGANADGVIGHPTTTSTLTDADPSKIARSPKGGLEDPVSGKFFVADDGRVLRYASRQAAESGVAPEASLGQESMMAWGSEGTSQILLRSAMGLAMDSAGKLWVSDQVSNRVVAFPNAATAATGSPMSVVLGQADFDSSNEGNSATGMRSPLALCIDPAGNLYVADSENNRVLRFNAIASKTSGAPANGVIGQLDLAGSPTPPGTSVLSEPAGVACDAQGRLWVADTGNQRVLRYNTPVTMAPLDPPSAILGGDGAVSPSGLSMPSSVAVDASGRLFVMDSSFNRVLRFDNAAAKASGANADGVLGAPNLDSPGVTGRTLRTFSHPYALFLDSGRNLWVADDANLRLMRFSQEATSFIVQSGQVAPASFSLTFHGQAGIPYSVMSSTDLKHWQLEASYTLPAPGNQVFTKVKEGTKRFYRVEEP